MRMIKNAAVLCLLAGVAFGGVAQAATNVTSDITTSETWTKAGSPYRLKTQIFVKNGATLTIEAGVVVASLPADQGSLAVSRGSDIHVQGTKAEPVVMTSTNDDRTNWREAANEWGNLTIMGRGIISASHFEGNPVGPATDGDAQNPMVPDGTAQKQMEGLTATPGEEDDVRYGGNDDYDDSGSITYLSIRYTGKVIGLGNELNGLSLGAIGRETDIHHVDIMNNVDDGIEIWGGTVNLKYCNIWNIGDDSFDIDEGWRGKAQFICIVQGYALNDSQGSGVGDNMFEHDGAERQDAQPVTTGVIYNATAIGQPFDGDGATTWRDNCRMQYRNCVFMDCGEKVVRFDDDDGDGALGYSGDKSGSRTTSTDGTLTWVEHWNTPYSFSHDADAAGQTNAAATDAAMMELYQSQVDGNLCEIRDSVFYNNTDYAEADQADLGIFAAANNNVKEPANMPIVSITRAASVVKGGKIMQRVTGLDPRAANDAAGSVGTAPADGFFTPAPFRGAFSPDVNWLEGWTAAAEYGFLENTGTNPDDPAAEVSVTISTGFQTDAGVLYTVEQSEDGVLWSPIGTIEGDGSLMTITDLEGFEPGQLYRAIAQ